jgi:hypothetical protein
VSSPTEPTPAAEVHDAVDQVKSVWQRLFGAIGAEVHELLSKLHSQADQVASDVKTDAVQDVSAAKADASAAEADAKTSVIEAPKTVGESVTPVQPAPPAQS